MYLDEVNDVNGPLCVIPGSHQWTERDLPKGITDDLPDQLTLRFGPGSVVLMHGSLWHRAMPTLEGGTVRRLLILGYGPTWMQRSIFGKKVENGLTEQLLRDTNDPEIRELLGVSGYY